MGNQNRSNEYWSKRLIQLEEAMENRGLEYYYELERAYQEAANSTQKQVLLLYSRLAENNNISLVEAKKLLTTNELSEFRWTVDEYIKRARENEHTQQWAKELENASLRYRISRLEAMRIHMQNHAELLMGHELDGISKLMGDVYTEGYYRTRHILETGIGIGYGFEGIDNKAVEKVLSKPWVADGRNFSERIWGVHRPQLINDLHTGLTQALIGGKSSNSLIDTISKKYNVAKHRAETLVRTERAYFLSLSQQDNYKELDVEEQQFVATLDLRTSDICRSMDGKIIRTCDIEIGRNAPPLHCRCRSIMTPYYEGNATERVARNKEGKTIYVDADMTYEDWYNKFIKE